MPRTKPIAPKANSRNRLDLRGEDSAGLELLAQQFELPKSEVVRRLIRAALEIGPAMSSENGDAVRVLAGQLLPIGRNLAQVVKGINIGYAPQLAELEPIVLDLHKAVQVIADDMSGLTVAYGSKLRRKAGLMRAGEAA